MNRDNGVTEPPKVGTKATWDSKHVLLYASIGFLFAFVLVLSFFVEGPSNLKDFLHTLAVAIGPVWMLGIIYQHFLFKEIRAAAAETSADALLLQSQPLIESITESAQRVQEQVENMMNLRDLGIERAFKRRKDVLGLICEWFRAEEQEIAIVGTSLRGLFWEELGQDEGAIGNVLKEKLKEPNRTCRFKILLTHPAFADLRQSLERIHRPEDAQISMEIRDTVRRLLEMGAKPAEIRFVRATPTCFAIKTSTHMLINPYPLENQSLASFCIIVGNHEGRNGIYTAFDANHFVFESANCTPLTGDKDDEINLVFNKTLSDLGLTTAGADLSKMPATIPQAGAETTRVVGGTQANAT